MAKKFRSTPRAVLFLFIAALSLLVGTAGAVPDAAFISNVTGGPAPLTVQFNDTSTGDPDGWAWYFGDETYGGEWTNQIDAAGWAARYDPTSVVMPNGNIILMGGSFSPRVGDVWRSTDKGKTWEDITPQDPDTIWSGRYGHAAISVGDSIVLMGGYGLGYKRDVWQSADEGATWTCVNKNSGWEARYDHTAVTMPNGNIILMGGSGTTVATRRLNDTWQSTDEGATWTRVAEHAEWLARYDHTSVVMPNGNIILMGGSGTSGRLNDVWRSTDEGATWTRMAEHAEWPVRHRHTSVTMPDGSIILMGGWGATKQLNDVWRSTDEGATWTQVAEHVEWSARYSHTSVVMPDGSIILMGGDGGDFAYKNDVWLLKTAGSNTQTPTHTYNEPGTYSVTLQAYNTDGYNAVRKVGYITVTAPVAPTAAFTANRTSGTAPLAVQFNDTSTGSVTAWNWSFGDGTWHNTTDAAERNVMHTYAAAGTYTVSLTVSNAGGDNTHTEVDYITVTAPVTPTPTATPTSPPPSRSSGGGGGGSTGGPDYNVGGDSAVSTVTVTGTGLNMLIVTGWKQSSPGSGIPPAPGTVYQYIDLTPARFETITGANITFTVPTAWLAENGFTPGEIVMHHYNGTAWEALPTWIVGGSGTTVTFRAASPGFSLFAISGIRDESTMTTPTVTQTTTQATAQPTATETTAVPAGDTAPEFPLGTVALIGGAILVLAAGGYLVRRWWMHRQNPALFQDYD